MPMLGQNISASCALFNIILDEIKMQAGPVEISSPMRTAGLLKKRERLQMSLRLSHAEREKNDNRTGDTKCPQENHVKYSNT